ncbi:MULTISPECIES: prephenate dehydratase [unclassified Burkholderia]|uniref:prephenate dehydratase n=1 Tax=unclassified Burkholderia TaxID=2613784 RepID=UPI0009FC0C9B|nr:MULTISPECIES: prephenate dehydratase [unclassified Burkholderia]MBR8236379.1 prephenate dehydratase [Burkholderia sp. AU32357]MBY4872911.1 prephenate dehydratase [Burkholderia sp. AU42008]OXI41231.1 chorismate mutase [Burkholderia sp. AU17457]OXI67842.1 chorismate mutase [Burkholderia sp. AU28863]
MTPTELAAPSSIDDAIARRRAQIDVIDDQLLELIGQRIAHATEIGHLKRHAGLAVRQPAREASIVAELCTRAPWGLRDRDLRAIWQTLFSASRDAQSLPSVAFLGPSGTYTETAMLRHFGEFARGQAHETIDAVFDALARGDVECAVVPMENSSEGTVTRTLDLLIAQAAPVTGEIELPVAHCLLSASGSLAGVDSVVGHPQALAQCRAWLDAHAPGLRRIPVSSNAVAAREAAHLYDCAAIAGEPAAALYGLRIVASAIQDHPDNRTRFVIVGGQTPAPTGHDRTSIVLRPTDAPDALARVFDALAHHRAPLLWVDVRPARDAGHAYRYCIDFGGHPLDPNVRAALDEIAFAASELRVLGAYPRAAGGTDRHTDGPDAS